jgi:cation diffusion facilitator CzcD-associated flavoprotein CzcO
MAEQLGHDPRLTKAMTPKFALGCRRMTPGSDYLQSLTKENVEVITESVAKFTEHGIVDESGNEHKADVVICATGFDVSFTPHFEVTGRKGANLKQQFGDFPKAYLGITAANFPNLFCTFIRDLHLQKRKPF